LTSIEIDINFVNKKGMKLETATEILSIMDGLDRETDNQINELKKEMLDLSNSTREERMQWQFRIGIAKGRNEYAKGLKRAIEKELNKRNNGSN
jgi:hypothetical protein